MKKIFVLGIDGLSYDLVNTLLSKNVLPNFAAIAKNGCLKRMNSTIPEVSSTAWSTFMTGVNPGRHGIFGFMDFERNSYKIFFPDSNTLKSETLWDIIGRHNLKSIVINLPSTYPAKKINGILTAGFVAIDLKKATYPDTAFEYLKSVNYRLDVDTTKAQKSLDDLFEDIIFTLEKRIEVLLHYIEHEWDLFIGTITETDRLHHFMWSASREENRHHRNFLDFYRRIDNLIGEIYGRLTEKYDDDFILLIVSDHGFTDLKQEVYLNSFLRENGYLSFKRFPPTSLEEIGPNSSAFALDPSRIYINRQGRYPNGCVSDAEYESVRNDIKKNIMALKCNGEQVVKRILFKEEIYSGPCYERAPDIVLLANHGYDLKGSLGKEAVFGSGVFTGSHTRDNAIFFINKALSPDLTSQELDIADVAATILKIIGIEDVQLDGRSLV